MVNDNHRREKGSVTEYRDGFRVWVTWYDAAGKQRRKSEVVRGKRRAANDRLRELLGEIQSGALMPGRKVTLAEFVAAWWPAKSAAVSPWTAASYRRMLDRDILPAIGRRPLARITGSECSAVISAAVERGAVHQADHLYVLLRLLFNVAKAQGAIPASPMRGVERPRPPRREMTVLEVGDWQRVRGYLEANDSWALPVLTLAITTGLRRSEVCGLTWGDVDIARSLLYVRRARHVIKGMAITREPKSIRSRRAVALDGDTVGMLCRHREKAEKIASLLGRRMTDSDPLFSHDGIRPFAPDSLTGVWRRTAKALGIKARLHDLRHSSATMLLAAGAPLQLVSARLGHASAGFTLSTYAGILDGQQEKAAEALAAMLNGKPKRDQLAHAVG